MYALRSLIIIIQFLINSRNFSLTWVFCESDTDRDIILLIIIVLQLENIILPIELERHFLRARISFGKKSN